MPRALDLEKKTQNYVVIMYVIHLIYTFKVIKGNQMYIGFEIPIVFYFVIKSKYNELQNHK